MRNAAVKTCAIGIVLLALGGCAQDMVQRPADGGRPDAAIYSYLSSQYPGPHHWRLANVTGPVRTQDGWWFDADVSCQPWSDQAEDWLPSTAWSHHRFLINGIVKWVDPPVQDPTGGM
jgi:hypothetical protein